MFSMCSELTPRAPILNGRMAQFMQPWVTSRRGCSIALRALLVTFFLETLYIKGRICQHACPEETLVFVSMGRWKEGYWGQLSASSWRSRRGKEGRQDRAVNGEFLGWKREEILRSIIKRGEETGQKPAVAKAGEAREDFLGKTDSNV